jgi:hypothetical protein
MMIAFLIVSTSLTIGSFRNSFVDFCPTFLINHSVNAHSSLLAKGSQRSFPSRVWISSQSSNCVFDFCIPKPAFPGKLSTKRWNTVLVRYVVRSRRLLLSSSGVGHLGGECGANSSSNVVSKSSVLTSSRSSKSWVGPGEIRCCRFGEGFSVLIRFFLHS